jgi:predicted ATPase
VTTLSQQRNNIDMGKYDSNDSELEPPIKLDYIMENFIERIENVKALFNQNLSAVIDRATSSNDYNRESEARVRLAKQLIDSILKGSYRYHNGTERIEFSDGQSTLINFASSGQQEVVWILLLILLLILNQRKVFLVIEEPEAHLFPVAQKQIIDLIALVATQNDNQVVLTTHSPYIPLIFQQSSLRLQLGKR